MPYYLSSWTGSGTRTDPLLPLGATGDWSVVDLSPNGQGDGACLLYTPTALTLTGPLASVVFLATSADDPLPNAVVTAANKKLGVSLPQGVTFRQAIRLLLTTEVGKVGKWKALQPSGTVFVVALGDISDSWSAE